MVKQFTCNSNCATFDTSLPIVFKPLSSNGSGTQPGSFLASDMWQIHFKKRCRWQMRPRSWEWAHIPELAGGGGVGVFLIGNANMLNMCLITHQGAGMILAQTWHISQWVNAVYVYYNQAERSKWPVQEAERVRDFVDMGEGRIWAWGMYSRLRLSVSRVKLVFSSIFCPSPTRILSSATIWLNYGQPLLLLFSSGM